MQSAKKINLQDQKNSHLRNVKNEHSSTLRKVKALEAEHHSNYSLLKRFLKELQFNDDNFLRMYNREVI